MAAGSEMQDYLNGEKLYGDDFSKDEIAEWFKDEEEAYAELGAKQKSSYTYAYYALNRIHGYRYLPAGRFGHVLSLGGAYGDELEPIAMRADRITIIDPSQAFVVSEIKGTPVDYRKANQSGVLPVATASCDLITCFGTLHHIPNVSFVVEEIARCLKSGGYALIREPTISMGGWRFPREGLTSRERGIPRALLEEMFLVTGLTVVKHTMIGFGPMSFLQRIMKRPLSNSVLAMRIDALLSQAFSFNERYHAQTSWHRVRPTAAFFVLHKKVN